MLKFKMVIAGAKNVGKTSLLSRFIDGTFADTVADTIGVAFKRKKLLIDENREVDLTIWDFGGEEKFRTLFPQYIQGALGALILFDTTREDTFKDMDNWMNILNAHAQKDMVKVLIGNKIDLKDERKISEEESKEYAKKMNFHGDPLGTSAKTGENVEKAFKMIAEGIVNMQFQRCSNCGEIFSKKLKICNYCGS